MKWIRVTNLIREHFITSCSPNSENIVGYSVEQTIRVIEDTLCKIILTRVLQYSFSITIIHSFFVHIDYIIGIFNLKNDSSSMIQNNYNALYCFHMKRRLIRFARNNKVSTAYKNFNWMRVFDLQSEHFRVNLTSIRTDYRIRLIQFVNTQLFYRWTWSI